MKKNSLFTILMATILLTLSSCTGSHTLFSNGKSDYSIVISPSAPESEQLAARELQEWIQKVSGAELPIVGLDGGQEGRRIILGYNELLTSLLPGTEEQKATDESFTYCNVGGDLLAWGGANRGTLYAVYSLLERELGCRWYTRKVSLAPEMKEWSFKTLFHQEAPALRMRDNNYIGVSEPHFAARMRNNTIPLPSLTEGKTIFGTSERYWNCHTMGQFIPADTFYDEHPEYFSMIDGKRIKEYTQLCLSNPEVLRICTEKMREAMRNHPDFLVYSLSQNDWFNPCQCPECQKIVDQYGGQQSGIMLWFVNQVADAVREEFPDKYVGTFAYQYTRTPPTGIQPKDNVVIRLCSIECCVIHEYNDCEENKQFMKDLETWSSIAPHLYIWDYVASFTQYCLPLPNFRTLQGHLRDFRDHNALGVMEEGDYQNMGAEMEHLRAYVLARLMWNPECNVDSLIQDFTDGYYGAAGPLIREYLDYEHNTLIREGIHQNCFPRAESEIYTEEFIREARGIFSRAKEAVKENPELLARVELDELPLCFLQLNRCHKEAMEQGAMDLFKRVVEREGITRLAEWGGYIWVEDFLKAMEELDKKDNGQ